MPTLSSIKNKRLRDLIKKSRKFSALSKKDQKNHLQKISKYPVEAQEKLCEFFSKENQKEEEERKTQEMKTLRALYDRVVKLEQEFNKLLKEEPEMKSKEEDKEKMNHLLTKLT